MAEKGNSDFFRRHAMSGKTSIRPAFPGSLVRGLSASGLFAAVIFAAVLLAGVFLSIGCASSKKARETEEAARTAEGKKSAEELRKALEEANAKITELERQIEELSAAKEEQESASEREIAQVKQTYETLVKDLEQEVESGKIKIERGAGEVKLNIAEELFFQTGKADIKPEGRKVLLRIGKDLQKAPGMNIRVEGHTDNVPIGPSLRAKYPTNWELAAARAVNVVRFLQQQAGIDPRRLSAVAFSQYRPVASNKTAAGKQRNRRVEIVLISRELDLAKKSKTPSKK
jgi:chemotaxis protein MotB